MSFALLSLSTFWSPPTHSEDQADIADPTEAHAHDVANSKWQANVILPEEGSEDLIEVQPGAVEVNEREPGDRTQGTVKLSGKVIKQGLGAYFEKKWLVKPKDWPNDTNGSFELDVPISGEVTKVLLKVVLPTKKIRRYEVTVDFPDWIAFKEGEEPPAKPTQREEQIKKRFFYTASLGASMINYTEVGTDFDAKYSAIAVTPRFALSAVLKPKRWEAGGNVYMTGYNFTKSLDLTTAEETLAGSTNYDARYLGVNARVSYQIQKIREPFTLKIMTGWYYTTMFVTSDKFGYQGMHGPQVFFNFSYRLKKKSAIATYFKFAPIAGLGILSREYAAGLSYVRPLKTKDRSIYVGLDFADLGFVAESRTVKTVSYTLNAGYTF